MEPGELIAPYGGELINRIVHPDIAEELRYTANALPSIQISERALCDLELIATGGFSPLDRFMGKDDYESVLDRMRLADGTLFPIPVVLPVADTTSVALDHQVALRDSYNNLLAVMEVEEAYEWDLKELASKVFGTLDTHHPLVAEMHHWGKYNISGNLRVLSRPHHHDFAELRLTPSETRRSLALAGRRNVVAFQTRNPMHRAHEELTKRATEGVDGVLLLHPVVGVTRPGDIDHYTRVRTYKLLTKHYYESDQVTLALLQLAMRMAGPREALWHAIIRRNFGANYLIVGRDHAGPGLSSKGTPFYGAYDAQLMVERYSHETGVRALKFSELAYAPSLGRYIEASESSPEIETVHISGTQMREEYLNAGKPLPSWFTRPEVAEILAESHPPRVRQGVCIWFTGLSGAGKSTTAEVLAPLLIERGRRVTLLDGDVVRTNLSRGLGFSRKDRDANILRIGYVASEIVKHGGVAVCAAISPYRAARESVRSMVGDDHFIEVFVDTPIEVCEARDLKGMYAKARAGEISGFTGIDDPYEEPMNPEIALDTMSFSPKENALIIAERLVQLGFIDRAGE